MIKQINGKVSESDSPSWDIIVRLGYNHTLLYISFDLLRKGYLGIAQSILRPVVENISLAMYFYEFPESIKEYNKNPKEFYKNITKSGYEYWIQGVLQRIDIEGKYFSFKNVKEGNIWENALFKNLAEDFSKFLHSNIDYIYSVVFSPSQQQYILGPNSLDIEKTKYAIYKTMMALIHNLNILYFIFRAHIDCYDEGLIKEAGDHLSKLKKELTEYTEKAGKGDGK